MKFYLGTHHPNWLESVDVPLFISRRRLEGRKRLPRAVGSWALDSGGFTELTQYGTWRTGATEYLEMVARFSEEIGNMEWAAPRDWMVEPWLLEKTGLSVEEHQHRTVEDFLDLRARGGGLPIIPALQGWTLLQYLACAELYAQAGVDLSGEPLVGIGSVCRRQQLEGGREVIQELAGRGIRLHAFGMKLNGLRELAHLLTSSDSMAWSYAARYAPAPSPGCTHRRCANCSRYALAWRVRLLERIAIQQPVLTGWQFRGTA